MSYDVGTFYNHRETWENFDVGLTVIVVLLFLIGREPIKVAAKLSIHPSLRAMRWSVLTRASTDSSCESKQNWRPLC